MNPQKLNEEKTCLVTKLWIEINIALPKRDDKIHTLHFPFTENFKIITTLSFG